MQAKLVSYYIIFKKIPNLYFFIFIFPSAIQDFSSFGSVITTFSVGGPTTNCIDFNITDDEELEGDHDFTVEITDISSMTPHAMIGSSNITVVTITDNEGNKLYSSNYRGI